MNGHSSQLPLCPVCCDVLGSNGGPSTLPCGHNGCLLCFSHVQARTAQCPMCRAPFDARRPLVPNHELRDLIGLATSTLMDDATKAEGWEAFPTAKLMAEHYAHEVAAERRGQPFARLLDLQDGGGGGAGGDEPSAPEMPPDGGFGRPDQQQQQQRAAALQYHQQYHQHPGLPTSAPSGTQRDILLLEPPQWLPDSYASHCGACQLPFKPLLRLRHHCRLCGKLFCHGCSSRQLLLPPRFRERDPQRVCSMCAGLLEPLQPFLVGAASAAVQPPVHDALDAVSLRSWLNSPWGASMAHELYKASNILKAFNEATRLEPERGLPTSLLAGARGIALMSVVRLGAGWSCTAGTGIVVSRQLDGTWSAPCAAACCGVGWGLQLGGELTDVMLVLRTEEAVRAFAAGATLGLGGSAGVALGPLGRCAEAGMHAGGLARCSRGAMLGYSCARGAFAGLSLEGSVTCSRDALNRAFYGYPCSARQLLVDCSVPQPPAASMLYTSLDALMQRWEHRGAAAAGGEAARGKGAAASSKEQRRAPAPVPVPAASRAARRASADGDRLAAPDAADAEAAAEVLEFGAAAAPAPAPARAVAASAPSASSALRSFVAGAGRAVSRARAAACRATPPQRAAAANALPPPEQWPSAPRSRVPGWEGEQSDDPQYELEW